MSNHPFGSIPGFDPKSLSILMACSQGDLPTIKSLVKSNADITKPIQMFNGHKSTALEMALPSGSIELIDYLFAAGFSPRKLSIKGNTLFEIACDSEIENISLPFLRHLVEKHKLDYKTNTLGFSFIHTAITHARTDLIDYALELGFSINELASNGVTPFNVAARSAVEEDDDGIVQTAKYIKMMKYLVEKKADVNIPEDEDKWTPLHYIADNGHPEVLQLLLELGGDINIKTEDGKTALELAQKQGRTKAVEILKKWKIDQGNKKIIKPSITTTTTTTKDNSATNNNNTTSNTENNIIHKSITPDLNYDYDDDIESNQDDLEMKLHPNKTITKLVPKQTNVTIQAPISTTTTTTDTTTTSKSKSTDTTTTKTKSTSTTTSKSTSTSTKTTSTIPVPNAPINSKEYQNYLRTTLTNEQLELTNQLFGACSCRALGAMKSLIAKKASPFYILHPDHEPFSSTIITGKYDTTQMEKANLFHVALSSKSTDIIDYVLSLGVNQDSQYTPFQILITMQNAPIKLFEHFVTKHNCDPKVSHDDAGTILHVGASTARPELIDFALKYGLTVDTVVPNSKTLDTPLLLATKCTLDDDVCQVPDEDNAPTRDGYIKTIKHLVQLKANINQGDYRGWTPLHYACEAPDPDIVEILLDLGANADKKDNKNKVPGDYSKCENPICGHTQVNWLLKQWKIKKNAKVKGENQKLKEEKVKAELEKKREEIAKQKAIKMNNNNSNNSSNNSSNNNSNNNNSTNSHNNHSTNTNHNNTSFESTTPNNTTNNNTKSESISSLIAEADEAIAKTFTSYNTSDLEALLQHDMTRWGSPIPVLNYVIE